MAARTLVWTTSDGQWADPANWTDITGPAQPAASPPGPADIAQITSAGTITGPAAAAALGVAGSVTLYGTTLTVAGTLSLATDAPTFPSNIGQLTLANHAAVQTGELDLSGYFSLSTFLRGGLTIDATSWLEVGTTGGATPGTLTIDAGHTVILGACIQAEVVNNGALTAEGFYFRIPQFLGAVSGTGSISLASVFFEYGGGAIFSAAVGAGQNIAFTGPNQLLELDSPATFAATISGFNQRNTIGLPASITSTSFSATQDGGVLTLFASGIQAGTLALSGAGLANASFSIGHSGTLSLLTTDAPCFAAGTRIATTRGPVPVESLRRGDLALTQWGEHLPIRWIGHRHIDCRRHPRPWDIQPIRVAAHAFAPGAPARDLHLSPDHAIFHDGMLIPARYLLNGATISQQNVPAITYWHVELDRHDVLLAENLPCESYLDTGNRAAFANGGPVLALHPDFAHTTWDTLACGRLTTDDAHLAGLRARLLARATELGYGLTHDAALRLAAGTRLLPHGERREGGGDWHLFHLPSGLRAATLRSRSIVPAQLCAANPDHRRLGLPVTGLRLDGATLALDDPRLGPGWHALEPALRWTDGAAQIDLQGATSLAVEAPPLLAYWTAPATPAARSVFRRSRP